MEREFKDEQTIVEAEIESGNFSSGGEVSSNLKAILRKLGIDSGVIRKVAIIAYELEMNIIIHSDGGGIKAGVSPKQIKVIAYDFGPGIEDISRVFQPGYSTASERVREMGFGAGMGLCNIKRYSDDMNVKSEVGVGTKIEVSIYLN